MEPRLISCQICGCDLCYQVEEGYPYGAPESVFVCNDDECLEMYQDDLAQQRDDES